MNCLFCIAYLLVLFQGFFAYATITADMIKHSIERKFDIHPQADPSDMSPIEAEELDEPQSDMLNNKLQNDDQKYFASVYFEWKKHEHSPVDFYEDFSYGSEAIKVSEDADLTNQYEVISGICESVLELSSMPGAGCLACFMRRLAVINRRRRCRNFVRDNKIPIIDSI